MIKPGSMGDRSSDGSPLVPFSNFFSFSAACGSISALVGSCCPHGRFLNAFYR